MNFPIMAAAMLIAGALAGAEAEAGEEARERLSRIVRGINEDLDHGDLTKRRFTLGLLLWLLSLLVSAIGNWNYWLLFNAVIYWPMMLSIFSLWHKWRMNMKSGQDAMYISPGNRYDMEFIKHWVHPKPADPRRWNQFHKVHYFTMKNAEYIGSLHRAGARQYLFEIILFAASLFSYLNHYHPW